MEKSKARRTGLAPGEARVGPGATPNKRECRDMQMGNTVKRKARLVARGFTQVEGIDYEETFAPTAKFVTVRLIVSLATSLGWPMEQADIDTAFL